MKKHFFLVVISVLFLSLPAHSFAAVTFNEIAWMGTAESQYGEWLELFNDGTSSVDLSGWKLYEEGGGVLVFTLIKSIPAGGYLVIERTTPSVPDPLPAISDEAGSFAGSGLSNSGEFLVLKDANGATMDSLDYGGGWPAGDSDSKETMQKTGGSWITAPSTPKAENPAPSGGGTTTTTESASDEKPAVIIKKMTATIGIPDSSYIGMPILFDADVRGTEDQIITRGYFLWNMGDGTTTSQVNKEPFLHTYSEPGDYRIVFQYFKNPYLTEPSIVEKSILSVSSFPLTVHPAISGTAGSIEIENTSSSEVELSGMFLKAGAKIFSFPKEMFILPNKKITISGLTTGFSGTDTNFLSLMFANGSTAYVYTAPAPILEKKQIVKKTTTTVPVSSIPMLQEVKPAEVQALTPEMEEPVILEAEPALDAGLSAAPAIAPHAGSNTLWLLLAIITLAIGITYAIWKRRKSSSSMSEADGFEIIE